MNLRSVNLNLLPVLRALLRDRSVLHAARSLSLSPSAASEALGRLRVLLGDPLLVQVGRDMRLTPYALDLVEPVDRLCAELEDVLRPSAFDPATLKRTFVIASLDYVALSAARALGPALRTAAPGVNLQFVDLSRDVGRRLIAGELDLVMVTPAFWTATESGRGLHASPLLPDRFVVMFNAAHPLAAKTVLTASDLLDYPHIGFHMDWDHGDHPSQPAGLQTPIRVQNHMLMPMLLDDHYLALAPRLFARQIAGTMPIEVREPPGEPMSYKLFANWGPVQHKDAAHRWFRRRLKSAMSQTLSPRLSA